LKAITTVIGSELALLCTAVRYQEGIKKQCKQMCEVFICGKDSMFLAQ